LHPLCHTAVIENKGLTLPAGKSFMVAFADSRKDFPPLNNPPEKYARNIKIPCRFGGGHSPATRVILVNLERRSESGE
jgi:hypothetical protein